MGRPAEFWAEALKARNLPTSNEAFEEGVRFTIAGTWLLLTLVLLPLLHETSKAQPQRARSVVPRDVPDANLPMHTFQLEMEQDVIPENSQCRGRFFFQQPQLLRLEFR